MMRSLILAVLAAGMAIAAQCVVNPYYIPPRSPAPRARHRHHDHAH